MKAQDNQFQTQLLNLVGDLVKQNNQVIQQNNQLINHMMVQSNQISELLLMLEDQEEASSPKYLDEYLCFIVQKTARAFDMCM